MLFFSYVLRSLRARLRANTFSMLAVGLFVIGGSLGLSFYLSLRGMLVDTARADNIIVMGKGAPSEAASKLPLETAQRIAVLPNIKKAGDAALVTRELVTRVYLAKEQVPIRGYDEQSFAVHQVRVVEGAMPAPGSLGILIGKRVALASPELKIGAQIALPGGSAPITGVFAAGGSPFEEEAWTPRTALELHINTKFSSSLTLVAESGHVPRLLDTINEGKDLSAQATTIATYWEGIAGLEAIARTVFALLVLLSIVATSAIAATMNAATATRIPEFGALAAIGLRRSFLARIVLLESIALATIGALVGVGLAAVLRTQLAVLGVDLSLSPSSIIALSGLGLGVLTGLIGGIVPSVRVRRLDIIEALR